MGLWLGNHGRDEKEEQSMKAGEAEACGILWLLFWPGLCNSVCVDLLAGMEAGAAGDCPAVCKGRKKGMMQKKRSQLKERGQCLSGDELCSGLRKERAIKRMRAGQLIAADIALEDSCKWQASAAG